MINIDTRYEQIHVHVTLSSAEPSLHEVLGHWMDMWGIIDYFDDVAAILNRDALWVGQGAKFREMRLFLLTFDNCLDDFLN